MIQNFIEEMCMIKYNYIGDEQLDLSEFFGQTSCLLLGFRIHSFSDPNQPLTPKLVLYVMFSSEILLWGWTGAAMPKEYLPWLETGHCFSAFIKCMQVGPDAPCTSVLSS